MPRQYRRLAAPCPFCEPEHHEPVDIKMATIDITDLSTLPYWLDDAKLPSFPAITEDVTVDVLIVGGGVTGISSAWQLKQAGFNVALVERDRCVQRDTGHTTAHLTAVVDERFHVLAKHFGEDAARAVWDAGTTAINIIESTINLEDIDCGFHRVPGYLHAVTDTHDERVHLDRELRTLHTLGITAEAIDQVPHFETPGIRFPDQALINPSLYLAALLKQIEGDGSHIFENSPAHKFSRDTRRAEVGGYRITFDLLVMATHNPLAGVSSTVDAMLLQTKLALQTTYAIGAKVPQGLLPAACFWNTGDPYGYLRVDHLPAYDYAIYGGADHKTGNQPADTEHVYDELATRFRDLVPLAEIDHRWSGQVIATPDGLPYIGELGPGQFLATGFAGNGITFGTLAALMILDAIDGRKNAWRELFSPERGVMHGGFAEYLRENKDYPYHLVRDRLTPAETNTLDAVAPEEGRIVLHEGRKVAAWRDSDGRLTLCSPVCPHLGCIVGWNDAETTWDCPCHGSRFKATGEVISGPAETSLKRLHAP